jgi:hypothetical protein
MRFLNERGVGSQGCPRAPDRIRERGVGRSPLAWEFEKHVETLPAIRYLRKGSVSRVRQRLELCARRVGEGAVGSSRTTRRISSSRR